MCWGNGIDWQCRNAGKNQHDRGDNTERRQLARRRTDVKEGEDAPGYASESRAVRGMWRLCDSDGERS